MSYEVINDRMVYGLKYTIFTYSNLSAVYYDETVKDSEFVQISRDDFYVDEVGAGFSSYVGVFNLDFYTPKNDERFLENRLSKIHEALTENNHYQTADTYYFHGGTVLGVEDPDEDDKYKFRITYQLSHSKAG